MNELSSSHYFLRLFTSTTNCAISFLFGASARICRENSQKDSIAKDSKFYWTIQVTLKLSAIGKSFKQTILV